MHVSSTQRNKLNKNNGKAFVQFMQILLFRVLDGFLDGLLPSFLYRSVFLLQFVLCILLHFFKGLVLLLVCLDLCEQKALSFLLISEHYIEYSKPSHEYYTAASLCDANFSFQCFSCLRNIFCFSFSKISGSLSDMCEKADILRVATKVVLLEMTARFIGSAKLDTLSNMFHICFHEGKVRRKKQRKPCHFFILLDPGNDARLTSFMRINVKC